MSNPLDDLPRIHLCTTLRPGSIARVTDACFADLIGARVQVTGIDEERILYRRMPGERE